MPILATIFGNKYVLYAIALAIAASAYSVWLHEHTARALAEANAAALAKNVIASNVQIAQLKAQKAKVETVVQTVTRKIYVQPSSTACATIPAIRDALATADELRNSRNK